MRPSKIILRLDSGDVEQLLKNDRNVEVQVRAAAFRAMAKDALNKGSSAEIKAAVKDAAEEFLPDNIEREIVVQVKALVGETIGKIEHKTRTFRFRKEFRDEIELAAEGCAQELEREILTRFEELVEDVVEDCLERVDKQFIAKAVGRAIQDWAMKEAARKLAEVKS